MGDVRASRVLIQMDNGKLLILEMLEAGPQRLVSNQRSGQFLGLRQIQIDISAVGSLNSPLFRRHPSKAGTK